MCRIIINHPFEGTGNTIWHINDNHTSQEHWWRAVYLRYPIDQTFVKEESHNKRSTGSSALVSFCDQLVDIVNWNLVVSRSIWDPLNTKQSTFNTQNSLDFEPLATYNDSNH